MGMFEWVDPTREALQKYLRGRTDFLAALPGAAYSFATDPQARQAAWDTYKKGAGEPFKVGEGDDKKWIDNALNFGPGALGKIVYHGSPHKFDKFDASKIGTGEGAQAYGHGVYLADSPEVAKGYADRLKQYPSIDRVDRNAYRVTAPDGTVLVDKALHGEANRVADKYYAEASGATYKADLPDEWIPKMLDWDKPLREQPEAVRGLLGKFSKGDVNVEPIINDLRLTAQNDYQLSKNASMIDRFLKKYETNPSDQATRRQLNYYFREYPFDREQFKTPLDALEAQWARPTGDAYKAAQQEIGAGALEGQLRQSGIPGIRYLDGGSRSAGQGSYNYVVFPGLEDKVKILERNGIPLEGMFKMDKK